MIRPDEFARFLASVRNSVASDLKPDLKSDNNRAKADSMLLVLDRIIADLDASETVAAARIATWSRLRNEAKGLRLDSAVSGSEPSGFLGAYRRLLTDTEELQHTFNSENRIRADQATTCVGRQGLPPMVFRCRGCVGGFDGSQ